MDRRPIVLLVKKMSYERVMCACGTAVFPLDPTPELTETIEKITDEYDAILRVTDANIHTERLRKDGINEPPVIIIDDEVYPVDPDTIIAALEEKTR